MSNFEQDVRNAANTKLAQLKEAGISDQLRSAADYFMGNQGALPAAAYGLGGAGIGAMAGSRLGTPGMLGGAALGGLMGYGGANAINQQGAMQQGTDMALAGGMMGGLGMNDQTDAAQTEAIMQQGQMIDNIVGYLSGGAGMAPEQDPYAMQDPMMQQGIGQPMDQTAMAGAAPGMPPGAMNGIGNPQQPGKEKKSSANADQLAAMIAKRIVHG